MRERRGEGGRNPAKNPAGSKSFSKGREKRESKGIAAENGLGRFRRRLLRKGRLANRIGGGRKAKVQENPSSRWVFLKNTGCKKRTGNASTGVRAGSS